MSQRGAIPILRVGSNLLTTIHIDLRDTIAEAFTLAVAVRARARGWQKRKPLTAGLSA